MELARILEEFARIRVLVVGDFCLDRWCTYDPRLSAPSRETGIPRTAVVSYESTPGAAGTVVNNLVALGAGRVDIVGIVGDDAYGWELERELHRRGVGTEHLLHSPARQTFTYTKLLNARTGEEDLPRVDFVNTAPPPHAIEAAMVEAISAMTPEADVVLVADQSEIASGAVITDAVRDALIGAAAHWPQRIFIADSRAQVEKFHGLIVKPNEDEALAACARLGASPNSVEDAGHFLHRHLGGSQPLYITRGPDGAFLFTCSAQPVLIPALRNDHPVDICGAGDAFESGMALTLAATLRLAGRPDYTLAAEIGHRVAAVTIMKKGTGIASREEVSSSKFQVPS